MAQQHQIGRTATNINTFNGLTVVRYHATDVVKFSEDCIILNSGGWHTNTTKTRMNQTSNQFELGYNVYQKDFAWFVDYRGKTYDFFDGMKLNRK